MAQFRNNKRPFKRGPQLKLAASKKEPESKPQPFVIKQRRLPENHDPTAPRADYHFRTAFVATRNALFTACPQNGICLNRLKSKGNGEWHNALNRFIDFLVQVGHIVVDYARQRIMPVKRLVALAGTSFYDEVMPSFAPA